MQDRQVMPLPFHRRALRLLLKCIRFLLYGVLGICLIYCIGLIPVNNGFEPAAEGVQIFLVSNPVHADVIVPVMTAEHTWAEDFADAKFGYDVSDRTHIAMGWGDKGFFLRTKTWDDFKLATAANALFMPSDCCVHVAYVNPAAYSDRVGVTISSQQYRSLVEYMENTLKLDEAGLPIQIPGEAYGINDAFFEAKGNYHMFNTCNSWVGRGLKTAGVKVPMWTPLPKTTTLYITPE